MAQPPAERLIDLTHSYILDVAFWVFAIVVKSPIFGFNRYDGMFFFVRCDSKRIGATEYHNNRDIQGGG